MKELEIFKTSNSEQIRIEVSNCRVLTDWRVYTRNYNTIDTRNINIRATGDGFVMLLDSRDVTFEIQTIFVEPESKVRVITFLFESNSGEFTLVENFTSDSYEVLEQCQTEGKWNKVIDYYFAKHILSYMEEAKLYKKAWEEVSEEINAKTNRENLILAMIKIFKEGHSILLLNKGVEGIFNDIEKLIRFKGWEP